VLRKERSVNMAPKHKTRMLTKLITGMSLFQENPCRKIAPVLTKLYAKRENIVRKRKNIPCKEKSISQCINETKILKNEAICVTFSKKKRGSSASHPKKILHKNAPRPILPSI